MASIPGLSGSATLYQPVPRTSAFLQLCFGRENGVVAPGSTHGVEIHEGAKVEKGGMECADLGDEFNPFNVRLT